MKDEGRDDRDEHGAGKADRVEFRQGQADGVGDGIKAQDESKRAEGAAHEYHAGLLDPQDAEPLLENDRQCDHQRDGRAPEGEEARIVMSGLELGQGQEGREHDAGRGHPKRTFEVAYTLRAGILARCR